MSKLQWQKPLILAIDRLPVGLGNCLGGNTETGQLCAVGDQTGVDIASAHTCSLGGFAGPNGDGRSCNSGNVTGPDGCSTGGSQGGRT